MASIEQVRREDAVAQLVNTAQGVASLLMNLSDSEAFEKPEREAFHLMGLALLNATKDASEAEDAARQ